MPVRNEPQTSSSDLLTKVQFDPIAALVKIQK